jgi:hypothetical protein|tara:strand:- start:3675 stop:6584 length:2910 start_codon:yes stop_codon:yes gene_type:complete
MARVQALQGSFVTGEISPRMQGNVLLESYKSSLATCLNYVVAPQGAVMRRPGTRYVTPAKNDSEVRLIPFNYGQGQSYVIEAGAAYFRFFTADGVLMDGPSSSTPLEVSTDADGDAVPYAVADLDALDITQSADTLFIVHPSYRPYTLKRTGTYTWVFAKLDLKHGPFDPVNVSDTLLHVDMTSGSLDKDRMADIIQTSDYIDITNERFSVTKHPFVNGQKIYFESSSSLPTGIDAGPGTQYYIINATENTFQVSTAYSGTPVNVETIGSGTLTIWKQFIPKDTTITLTSYNLLSDCNFTASDNKFNKTSHGFANGTKMRFVRSVPVSEFTIETIYYVVGTADNDFQLSASEDGSAVTGATNFQATTLHANGILGINSDTGFQTTDVNRYIRLNNEIYPHIRWGYAQIATRTSTSVVTAKVKESLANEFTTKEWALGAFSGTTGYPRTVQIYQQRLVFAGTTSEPQNIYFSKTGDFNNFATTEGFGKDSGSVDSTGAKIVTEQIFDDNAITLQISSDTVDLIEWLNEDARLSLGTSGGIFQVYGSDTDSTLTPFNFTIKKITDWASEDTALPQKIGNNLLYVQQNGRKVRELIFDNEQERYSADDISIRSENLSQEGIVEMSYQDQPHALLWCRKADGKLASCTYVRNQQVIGWHRHEIAGTHTEATANYGSHAKVERMVSIPRTNYDQMWFVVKRSINLGTVTADASTDKLALSGHGMVNGTRVRVSTTDTLPAGLGAGDYYVRDTATNDFKVEATVGGGAVNITSAGTGTHTVKMMDRRYVEYLDKFYDSSETDANAAHFLDGGAIYSGGSTTSITGLGYLEGETVSLLGDGAAQPDKTVSAGAITAQLAVTRAHVGLSYNSDLQTLPLAIGTADNTSVGNQKRIHRIIVRFYESMSLSYGMSSDDLTVATFRRGGDSISSALPLFSGDKELVFPSNYDTLGQAYLRCSQPFPSTITLLALDYETND